MWLSNLISKRKQRRKLLPNHIETDGFFLHQFSIVLYRPGFRFGLKQRRHKIWWCIFRPTHIRHTPLLTYAKSAILQIRPTSTWYYSCYMDLWPQRPAPQPVLAAVLGPLACPSHSARPTNMFQPQRSAHKVLITVSWIKCFLGFFFCGGGGGYCKFKINSKSPP